MKACSSIVSRESMMTNAKNSRSMGRRKAGGGVSGRVKIRKKGGDRRPDMPMRVSGWGRGDMGPGTIMGAQTGKAGGEVQIFFLLRVDFLAGVFGRGTLG